jgi:hypothetical protein
MEEITIRQIFTNCIRFWEIWRILYNLVLAGVVVCVYRAHLPDSAKSLDSITVGLVFIYAVLANVAYCAAYVVDVFVQMSTLRSTWLRLRWTLLVIGMLFASVLTWFIASDLFMHPAMPMAV